MWRTRPRVDENEVPTQDVIGPRGAERACRRARSCSRRRKPGQPRAKHGVEVLVATRNRLNRAARVSERSYPQTLVTSCLVRLGERQFAQETKVLQHFGGAYNDRSQRIFRQRDWESCFYLNAFIKIFQ